jgi:hypothetical protein
MWSRSCFFCEINDRKTTIAADGIRNGSKLLKETLPETTVDDVVDGVEAVDQAMGEAIDRGLDDIANSQ